jgi:hypothetical protein
MKLKSVKILGNGFGGLLTTHLTQVEKNGRVFNKEVKEKNKQPIHLGLENKFKELRPFYLELCRILRGDEDKATKDYTIQETEITGLQIVIDTTEDEGTGFILEGSILSLGNKEIKPKTAKIESGDNYHNFDAVQLIIKEIITEVEHYMSGSVQVTDEEVLVRWFEKTKEQGVDIEAIKNMSPDEQKELLSSILEKKFGCVVLEADGLVVDDDTDITEDLIAGGQKTEVVEETFTLNADENVLTINKTPEPILKKA